MLDTRQIDLVQDSFAAVVPITDIAAATFYRRLFELAPDTRPLFKGDMAEQGRKLFLTLATVVDALDRLDTIVPVARQLAIRHVAYGAKDRHYAAVGTALIETLRVGLGSAFDRDTEAAWSAAYAILADTMLQAVRETACTKNGASTIPSGNPLEPAGGPNYQGVSDWPSAGRCVPLR